MLAEQDLNRTYRGRWRNNSVVLLIGGNQGDRLALLMMAIREIANRIGTVSVASSIYETEPWGFEAEQSFLNQALVVDTDLDASTVLDLALEIEKDLGRVRPEDIAKKDSKAEQRSYSSRPIDIDLIFYNSDVVENDRLVLPHPRMQQRRFVLQPLAQIIPDFRHPILRKTMNELLEECSDKCEVKIYF
ncbi:MAG: 2-amino-4-hydroxy-6-hydroxymethyldihydropteridine diphosphokinase [Bacteroidales bacterium]|nr:2-amino-4-hydroxy-6-hydroxymethyldihydropteridine diphosphokinase [Bacteroidales bacterium]